MTETTTTPPEGSEQAEDAVLTVLSPDTEAKTLAKYSLPDEKIAKMKKFVNEYAISGPEDLVKYKEGKTALSRIAKTRTGIEKIRKSLKAPFLSIGKSIDKEAARLSGLILPLETMLGAKLAVVDNAIAAAKEKEKIRRHTAMINSGFEVAGGIYVAGIFNYTAEQVHSATEELLLDILTKGQSEKLRKEAEKKRTEEDRKELEELRKQAAIAKASGSAVGNPTDPAIEPAKTVYEASMGFTPASSQPPIPPSPPEPPVSGAGFYAQGSIVKEEWRQSAIETTPIPPAVLTAPGKSGAYVDGFMDCRNKIIKIMESDLTLKRTEWVQLVKELKP